MPATIYPEDSSVEVDDGKVHSDKDLDPYVIVKIAHAVRSTLPVIF